MTRFRYRSYDAKGALTEGDLEAASRASAIDALHGQGLLALEVLEASAPTRTRWWETEIFGSTALPLPGLALFTRELATMVRAEVPLDETLRIVSLQPLMSSRLRAITRTLLDEVRQGTSLSAAMAGQGFPLFYSRLIEAAETSSSLPDVLDDLAAFLERTHEARAQIMSSLIYPIVLLVAAFVTVGIILSVLVPSVAPLFEDAGAELPGVLSFLVSIHGAVAVYWPWIVAMLAAAVVVAAMLLRRATVRLAFDRLMLRVPFIGTVIGDRETARFARTLATMTRNGVPMLEAVRVSGSVLRNRAFAVVVEQAGAALKEGGNLTRTLERSGLFSELAVRLISVGEQTSQLDVMLMRVAAIYEAAVQRQTQRFVTLLTPALTLIIGGIVGSLIVSVMSAILSVNELALR